MPTVTKFANANATITTGWTSPTNAYADDGTYATAAPAKSSSVTTDYGFPAFTTSDIPAGSIINSVTAEIQDKSSTTASTSATITLQLKNNATLLGSAASQGMSLTDQLLTHQVVAGITQADLQSANLVKAQVAGKRVTSNTAITWSLDYVKLTVDYTLGPTLLVVADAALALAADSPALTQQNTLVVANGTVALAGDAPALVQQNTLVVASAALGLAVESPTLDATLPSTTLAPADGAIALALDSPALVQANTLAVADSAVALAGDAVGLVQANTLAVQSGSLALGVDSPALTQANVLAPSDSALGAAFETPTLVVQGALGVDDAVVVLGADAPALIQANVLVVENVAVSLAAESIGLTQAGTLTIQHATVALTSDGVAVVQANVLSVADALLALAFESPTPGSGLFLDVADALAALSLESPDLVVAHILTVSGATISLAAESPALTQAGTLELDDATIALAIENVGILPEGQPLVVADVLVSFAADGVVLSVPPDIVLTRSGPAGVVRALSGPSYLVDRSHYMRVILGNDYDFEYKIIKRSNRTPLELSPGQHLYGYFAAATGGSAIDPSLKVELTPLSGGRGFLGTVTGAAITTHLTALAGQAVVEVIEIPGGTLRREREVDVVAASS